ncbi:MAG: pilus assembly protein TadG-related protein [Bacillota bacterium]|nr:pilus assembly protein TadG-related protein [Bacillota bacterium]
MWRHMSGQDGYVLPVFVVFMTVVIGIGAITLDAGRMYTTKLMLRNISDAAALAGVASLPGSTSNAIATAIEYAVLNGADPDKVLVEVSSNNDKLMVAVTKTLQLNFAGLISAGTVNISATSTAGIGVTRQARMAQPFGIEDAVFVIGESYVLKVSPHSSDPPPYGNFYALALGLPGAKTYSQNIMYGYDGWISVGDMIETEPGNMDGPTSDGVRYRINQDPGATFDKFVPSSPRVILIPIVDSFEVNGRTTVRIEGFASFFLESYNLSQDEIVGRFMRRIVPGDAAWDGGVADYGTSTVKLMR